VAQAGDRRAAITAVILRVSKHAAPLADVNVAAVPEGGGVTITPLQCQYRHLSERKRMRHLARLDPPYLEQEDMKRFVIERELPGVGRMNGEQLKGAAATSNDALGKLAGEVQWVHSYVADDKTFCIYLAESEADVKEHARLSGFPANKITEVRSIIDPISGNT
jgi:Protein of unknown function (DUF4242)